ncbi:hypothetical protein ACI6Q5_10320 [Xanthomonas codiaei]|uniref:IclR-ED domain-containing protein n=1 Tax=Xanthomonas codiaei TaxID=56463 RepID=A0ABW9MM88_9XANT
MRAALTPAPLPQAGEGSGGAFVQADGVTLALCVAPPRRLSRSAQMVIPLVAAKIDAMAVPAVG